MREFNIKTVKREEIIKMLQEEQKVRYSTGIQEAYTKQYLASKSEHYELVNIEQEIQKFVLNNFGFTTTQSSLEEYWKVPSTYWNDEEVKNSIFYMRLNIFQYPKVKLNDDLIDVSLLNDETNLATNLATLQTDKPLILLAGSMT